MKENDKFTNIIELIRENFIFLIRHYFLFSILLLFFFIIFYLLLSFFSGAALSFINIFSFFFGAFIAIFCAYFCFPFSFKLISNRESALLSSPLKLFNLYYAVGIFFSIFLTIIPLIGLLFIFLKLPYMATLYYLMGITIVTFFLQIGSGLFAKGADISSEILSKENENIATNDFRNVASLADKVGDFLNSGLAININLIEIFIGMFVAVILFVKSNFFGYESMILITYPFIIAIGSLVIGFFSSFLFLLLKKKSLNEISAKPLYATYLSLIIVSIYVYIVSTRISLPFIEINSFFGLNGNISPFFCVFMGILFFLIIGLLTDKYTSETGNDVKDTANYSQYSSILAIFKGTSLGMRTVFFPIIIAIIFSFISFNLCGYYGILLMSVGFCSILPIIVASSFSAPFFDMMNGAVEMSQQEALYNIREIQKMNSVGNTLSAVAKHSSSYAILFLSFSFFLSFFTISGINYQLIPLFHPVIMLSLFLGGLLPYIFVSALLKGLSEIVVSMYDEAKMQLEQIPYLKEGKTNPDLRRFMKIHVIRIAKALIIPSLLIFFTPFIIGKFLSVEILASFFIGCIIICTFLSISYTNTGVLLGNTKNLIEKGYMGGKNTQRYENSSEADCYGDCVKDVLSPALNALLKVIILITIIFVPIII
jgi:K(+)-stimulated pyrophosphate-energized sodium pump